MENEEYPDYYIEMKAREIAFEEECVSAVFGGIKDLVQQNREAFKYCWRFGDGDGGGIFEAIRGELNFDVEANNETVIYQKKTISRSLRKAVFERDLYRCKHCGTHLDLTVDHIYPESKGGTLELDNLQTLCRSCNSKKGVKCDK